jgi:hypothetical protein
MLALFSSLLEPICGLVWLRGRQLPLEVAVEIFMRAECFEIDQPDFAIGV